jgi:hypothetical protein
MFSLAPLASHFDTVPLKVRGAVRNYLSLEPQARPEEVHPYLTKWLADIALSQRPSHQLMAGSMALEAALGAAHTVPRRHLLRTASRHLSTLPAPDKASPGMLKNAAEAERYRGVIRLLATRSLADAPYRQGMQEQLGDLLGRYTNGRHLPIVARNHVSGLITEQTIACLLHDRSAGLLAVPSMSRHDMSKYFVDGKKYRWDVTVESTGETIPAGQYFIQSKTNATEYDLKAYHPDIQVVSGSKHLGDNPYMETKHVAAKAIVEGDAAAVAVHREHLLELLSNTQPAAPELNYLQE